MPNSAHTTPNHNRKGYYESLRILLFWFWQCLSGYVDKISLSAAFWKYLSLHSSYTAVLDNCFGRLSYIGKQPLENITYINGHHLQLLLRFLHGSLHLSCRLYNSGWDTPLAFVTEDHCQLWQKSHLILILATQQTQCAALFKTTLVIGKRS